MLINFDLFIPAMAIETIYFHWTPVITYWHLWPFNGKEYNIILLCNAMINDICTVIGSHVKVLNVQKRLNLCF